MDYLEWNNRLGAYFFNKNKHGQVVLLSVTRDVIKEIGSSKDQGIPEFIEALKTCRKWGGRVDASMTGLALKAYNAWKNSNKTGLYPYYLGYLSFFALAAAEAGGSYYASLWQLWDGSKNYGWPNNWDRMPDLWEDLEYWCNIEHEGKIGRFIYGSYGSWIYAGIPITQTILTEAERKELGLIFANAGFDPGLPPSDEELVDGVLRYGNGFLNRRTIRILEGSSGLHDDFKLSLIDMLHETLNELNFNEITDFDSSTEEDSRVTFRTARLSIQKIDNVSGEILFTVIIKSNPPLPEDGVSMVDFKKNKYIAIPCTGSFSFPIHIIRNEGRKLFTPVFDWSKPFYFYSNGRDVVISGREVRIFHLGTELGIKGWIEYPSLRPNRKVLIACSQNASEDIDSWGKQFCPGWRKLNFETGMPPGWSLFSANSVSDTRFIEGKYPQLRLPADIKIRLVGGLSVRRQYLPGMLPFIEVNDNPGVVKVSVNDKIADQDPDTGLFQIPAEEQQRRYFVVQVENGSNERPLRKTFHTIDLESLPEPSPPYLNNYGETFNEKPENVWIQGPLVMGLVDQPGIKWRLKQLKIKSADLIGRKPGEITPVDLNNLPDWEPVWAITKGRKRRALFCAAYNPFECFPLDTKTSNRKDLRRWKEVIFHRRKRISLPADSELAALWRKYVEAAHNAED